jgi:hypothetical protein
MKKNVNVFGLAAVVVGAMAIATLGGCEKKEATPAKPAAPAAPAAPATPAAPK